MPQVLISYEQSQKMHKWPVWYLFAASNPAMWFVTLFAIGSPITMAQEILNSMLVNDKASLEYIGCVADRLNRAAQAQGYDYFHKTEFIAAFVQSIPYNKIILPTNMQYPPQVIAHGGDCINKSVLLAAILEKARVPGGHPGLSPSHRTRRRGCEFFIGPGTARQDIPMETPSTTSSVPPIRDIKSAS